jgi:succinate dehydrogenase / fumarate reductase, membrane anchor subunit
MNGAGMRAEAISEARGGFWPWLLQRITAVLLVLLLGVHLVVNHLMNVGELTFESIGRRLAGGFLTAVDILLLAAALFHGLNGLRMVLLDYGFGGESRRILDAVLWVVGVACLVFGLWGLWPWIGH